MTDRPGTRERLHGLERELAEARKMYQSVYDRFKAEYPEMLATAEAELALLERVTRERDEALADARRREREAWDAAHEWHDNLHPGTCYDPGWHNDSVAERDRRYPVTP